MGAFNNYRLNPILIAILLLSVESCKRSAIRRVIIQKNRARISKLEQTPANITVFIHGTKPPFPEWIIKLRKSCFSFNSGLIPVECLPHSYHVRNYVESISNAGSEDMPIKNFYIFGWSGRLDHKERERESASLYKSLKWLSETYQRVHGIKPNITLITHSHGGNVALNLAKVKDYNDKDFFINRLILLACPVQRETSYLIKESVFGKIYSLYSSIDMLQVLDPQGFHKTGARKPFSPRKPLFSKRRFPFISNLKQVKIKLNGFGMGHTAFVTCDFGCLISPIIKEIDSWPQDESNIHYLLCVKTKNKKIARNKEEKIIYKK